MKKSKMKMDEWNDRYIRLKRNITRRDGAVLRRGTIYKCGGHWRGRLRLLHPTPDVKYCYQGVAVTGVNRFEVRLLPKSFIPL